MITQDSEAQTATAPPIKRRLKRTNLSISPRTTGIAMMALQQFMGNAFIEEIREMIEIYDAPFDQEEMTIGVVYIQ